MRGSRPGHRRELCCVLQMRPTDNHSMRFPLVYAWLLTVALFLVCSLISFAVMAEDAYISFRYAENIGSGLGPVFNDGGAAVEGYSNPLWVGLLAIDNMVGVHSGNAARCLGLLFGALVLLEVMLLVRLVAPEARGAGPAAGVILATAPPFLFWSQAGLETSLSLYLLLLGLRWVLLGLERPGRLPLSAVPLLLLAVARPEGIMYFVVIGAYIVVARPARIWEKGKASLIASALIVLVPFVVFLLWRHEVFGAWVPNTFFAKVNNGLRHNCRVGFRYLVSYLNHSFWLPVLIPAACVLIRRNGCGASSRIPLQLMAFLALAQVAFLLYVGGDIHPYDRFCLPLLAMSVLTSHLAAGERGERAWWKRAGTWVTVVFLAGNLAYWFPPAARMEPPMCFPPNLLAANLAGLATGRTSLPGIWRGYAGPRPDALDLVGRDLARNAAIEGLLATDQCGKIPYWSGLSTVDLFGLNDPAVARIIHSNETWDRYAEEILGRAPDVFVVFYLDGHLVSDYYLQNMLLSEPARMRYALDAVYHVDYSFFDVLGREHTFAHELLRFRRIDSESGERLFLTEAERRWFVENEPIVDTPDALGELVEGFRAEHRGDPERLIRFHVSLN